MKIEKSTVESWRARAADWLADNSAGRATLDRIKTGREAWMVAHCVGIVNEAYAIGREIHDAHIQTALEQIFPSAVFLDKKHY